MMNYVLLWYSTMKVPPRWTPSQELARWRWQHGLRVGYSNEMSLAEFLRQWARPEMFNRSHTVSGRDA